MIYTYVIIYGFEIISYPEISLQRDSGAVKGKLVACIVDIIICINFSAGSVLLEHWIPLRQTHSLM